MGRPPRLWKSLMSSVKAARRKWLLVVSLSFLLRCVSVSELFPPVEALPFFMSANGKQIKTGCAFLDALAAAPTLKITERLDAVRLDVWE